VALDPLATLRRFRRVIIDGDTGAGKTTLAKHLAEEAAFARVALDDYLRDPGKPYADQIDHPKLKRMLDGIGNSRTVLEGCLASKVAREARFTPDCLILAIRADPTLPSAVLHPRRLGPPRAALARELYHYLSEEHPPSRYDYIWHAFELHSCQDFPLPS
jgi:hypothetical protein